MAKTRLAEVLKKNEEALVRDWTAEQIKVIGTKIGVSELTSQCRDFLRVLTDASQTGDVESIHGVAWKPVREFLSVISRSRGLQGFSPSETAVFVFSLKHSLFGFLLREIGSNAEAIATEITAIDKLIDQLGLFTTETYQKAREEVIIRQQQELLELSTPVVKLWDGILALPMIGTLDSSRTQVVMETLLQKIVETGSETAIIDITGVPTVDTLVAQHLIKTVTAARLMGAECIISGIRPQIAATIVHLGVDLGNIATKATLADAFGLALTKLGRTVRPISHGGREARI